MFALGLLACAVLTAFRAHAEVVHDFNGCKQFFYMGTEPGGMDQNAKTICQVYNQSMGSYYATLYSTEHRIPLYSAYIFDPKCENATGRSKTWHVEPQISGYRDYRNMVREGDLRKLGLDKRVIKRSQAIDSDYKHTGYDRGHLNPSSFNCGDGRTATYTLTNAAPMNPRFNQGPWRNWEETLRSVLIKLSINFLATAYIVTGTVPNANLRIPQNKSSEDSGRVTVPSHVWTAVCYKHPDESKSFSFGYMGENQPEQPGINPMSVSDLNVQLSTLYSQLSGTPRRVSIFADTCFGDDDTLNMVKLLIQSVKQGVQLFDAVKSAIGNYNQKVRLKEMSAKLAFDSMDTYYTIAENLKVSAGRACLITGLRSVVRKYVRDELRKREVSEESDAVECLLVLEKQMTAADGSACSSVSESSDSCECHTGGKTKPCCSSSCLYQPNLKSYRCNSGQRQIACSPRYSLITVNGERCLDDHPCATYGYDYYWCNTVSDCWDHCSPPLRNSKAANGQYCRNNHACAKYGKDYMWCYTDDEDHYDECCTSDDCYSAVNNKTCRSNHKCGYHGKKYLWCYTDNSNNWDFCCTNCA